MNTIDNNIIIKFKNSKFFRKGLSFVLVVTTLSSLSSYKSSTIKEEKEILDDYTVATINGKKEVLKNLHLRDNELVYSENFDHNHYMMLSSGEVITEIKDSEPLLYFLAYDECLKIINGTITNEDWQNINARINNSQVLFELANINYMN